MKNKGFSTETDIINYINNRKYLHNMNQNMQLFLKTIFEDKISNEQIFAYKFGENYKPDIIIKANGTLKYISIKTGYNNSVHQEHIYSLLFFLSEIGVSKEAINALRSFHFNDGTLNGSGKIRKSAAEFQKRNQKHIQLINTLFDKDETKEKIIDRLLFKGEYNNLPIVDYVYHGDIQSGNWASRQEILTFLMNTQINSNSIHCSKLYYQSLYRNLKHNKYYEYRRYYSQFKWHSIKNDLQRITKKRE